MVSLSEKAQKEAQEIWDAVVRTMQKQDSTIQADDKKVIGIVIIAFSGDHSMNTSIIGKICPTCAQVSLLTSLQKPLPKTPEGELIPVA